ncbi:hypothetical protein P154DRAFT_580154 [Amniculicola lignicola CBS 123094]|uniref:Interferon-induced 6-16 n=1 Tax=Amniculicola lignicola CBS 123094 TaxID=1392246 RepID=A0A6A5W4N7_9PLEO|nr:hypothetical protein P154DRAFT_580154 [Amniculicola lignicola CBS 123094]
MGNRMAKAVNIVKDAVVSIFRRIAPPIVQYVVKHPIRSLFHVGSFISVCLAPVITAPLLGLVGFTGVGVAAGSLAAGIQSGLGNVVAGGVFATLQSAAMGGYGAATVAGAVAQTAIAAEAIHAAIRR